MLVGWLYWLELRDGHREDRLWETRRARLLALNKRPPRYDHDPDAFVFAPGAMWIVDTPKAVTMMREKALIERGLFFSGAAVEQRLLA